MESKATCTPNRTIASGSVREDTSKTHLCIVSCKTQKFGCKWNWPYLQIVEVRSCSNGNLAWRVALILSVVCVYGNLLCACECWSNHITIMKMYMCTLTAIFFMNSILMKCGCSPSDLCPCTHKFNYTRVQSVIPSNNITISYLLPVGLCRAIPQLRHSIARLARGDGPHRLTTDF